MSSEFEGACLCGAVRFLVRPPTNWCAHCHCTLCQRSHGAAFVTWIGVPNEQFEITSGGELIVWYRSSEAARRGFCSRCGSSMFFDSERWPEEIHVTRANIPGAIDREPEGEAFVDTRVAWLPTRSPSAESA